jgi:hypothetical protein
MAIAKWRQRRYWGTEAATLDLQMDKQAKEIAGEFDKTDEMTRLAIAFQTLSDTSSALRLLDRYLAGIRRDYSPRLPAPTRPPYPQLPQPRNRRDADFTEQTQSHNRTPRREVRLMAPRRSREKPAILSFSPSLLPPSFFSCRGKMVMSYLGK